MDTKNLKLIESLEKNIYNKNGKICLETEVADNVKYAFYLRHSQGEERQYYSNEPSKVFDIPFQKGMYEAIFFYQIGKGGERKRKVIYKQFFINNSQEVNIVEKLPIAEEEGWKIDFYDVGSKTTFIVFNAAGATKSSRPFGLRYLISKGYNVVACLHENNQYQSLSFGKFREVVSPIVEDHEVFLYGSSVGGYGAIYYAGAVGGTVISGAPRNPDHPLFLQKAGITKEARGINFEHTEIHENPLTNKNIYIMLDPFVELDVFYVNNLIKRAYSSPHLIKSPHAGHEVLYHLNHTKQLSALIESIVAKDIHNIKIDENIESAFTDYNKAKYYFSNEDYENVLVYANKALEEGDTIFSDIRRKKLMKILNKSLEEQQKNISSRHGLFAEYRFD